MTAVRAVALAAVLVASTALPGCGLSPIQAQAAGISVAADLTSGAEDAIDVAVRADLHSTCPTMAADCAETVRTRWAPVDAAVNVVVEALIAWTGTLEVTRLAEADPGAAVWRAARVLVAAYDGLRTALAPLGVTIPPLPDILTGLLGGA